MTAVGIYVRVMSKHVRKQKRTQKLIITDRSERRHARTSIAKTEDLMKEQNSLS